MKNILAAALTGILSQIGFSFVVFGQAGAFTPASISSTAIPPSPDASAVGEYFTTPVSLYAGVPDVTIPLVTLPGRALSAPVALSYHAGGIQVDEIASRAGLGWALSAGGSISRTVQGLADESSGGFLNFGSQLLQLQNISGATVAWTNLNAQQRVLLTSIAKGDIDGLPDAFWVSAPGLSGKIHFDENGVPRIVPHQKVDIQVNWIQKTWTLRNESGVTYHFGGIGAIETTEQSSDCGENPQSIQPGSWMLTRMEDQNGDRIDFQYEADGYSLVSRMGSETATYVAAGAHPVCGGTSIQRCSTSLGFAQLRLREIVSAQGMVLFFYDSTPRLDLSASHRLMRVELRDQNQAIVKGFDLNHQYWSGRLCLQSVTESENGASKPPFSFQYDQSHALPPYGSARQDHWGYSNGKNNSSLLPYTPMGICDYVGQADRSPELAFCKSGTLTQIQFPGGGITRFDYELHQVHKGASGYKDLPMTRSVMAFCDANSLNCGGSSQPEDSSHFDLSHPQCVVLIATMLNTVSGNNGCGSYVVILDRNTMSELARLDCGAASNTQNVNLPAGQYVLKSGSTVRGDQSSATVDFVERIADPNPLVGGLRVRLIETQDGIDPANDQVQEFRYLDKTNPSKSSGVLLKEPIYQYIRRWEAVPGTDQNPVACNAIVVLANGIGLSGSNEQQVGYTTVQTLHGAGGVNGSTWSHFSSIVNVSELGAPPPMSAYARFSHRRGLLESELTLDVQGNKVTETLNQYAYRAENRKDIFGFQTAYSQSSEITGSGYTSFFVVPTPFLTEWMHPLQTVRRQYAQGGGSYVETIETFEYSNPVHCQMTGTRSSDSQGRELITRIRYPADFASGNGDANAIAITSLKTNLHIHNVPIETTLSEKWPGMPEQVLAGQLMLFKAISTAAVLPHKSLVLEASQPLGNFQPSTIGSTMSWDSRYTERETAESYNQHGQVISVLKKNGIRVSFQYGYNSTLPIAQTVNGLSPHSNLPVAQVVAGDASYNGFESGHLLTLNADNHFWEYNAANTVSSGAYSGQHCVRIAPGNPQYGPIRQLRPSDQNQRFQVSAWVKVPSGGSARLIIHSKQDQDASAGAFPTGNGIPSYTSLPIAANGGNWQFVEAWLDLAQIRQLAGTPAGTPLRIVAYVMNTSSTQPVFVDEMRVHGEMARMTTAVHKPLVGVLTSSDANSHKSTFEYDALQRLRLVRDRDSNIMRRITYQYAGQNGAANNSRIDESAQVPLQTEALLDAAAIGSKFKSVSYFDGLGRVFQSQQLEMGIGKRDLVSWSDYDALGRIPRNWLPYARPASNGSLIPNPLVEQTAFYSNGGSIAASNFPWADTRHEAAVSGRVIDQGNVGAAWQLPANLTANAKPEGIVRMAYLVNKAIDNVLDFRISGNDIVSNGSYPESELTLNRRHGEDGELSFEFSDKLGRTILRKTLVWSGSVKTGIDSVYLETYWVYDAFGNVAAVIPPKAVEWMRSNGVFALNSIPEDFCFRYKYDARQRMAEKHVPGKGWEYIVYDNLDRPVLSQDENLRLQGKWLYSKHDVLGRVVKTGIFADPAHNTQPGMQQHLSSLLASGTTYNHELKTGVQYASLRGYTDRAFPAATSPGHELHSVLHYDDYDFDRNGTADVAPVPDADGEYSLATYSRLRDLVTATETKVLADVQVPNSTDWLRGYSFFDKYHRPIHTLQGNHLGGQDLSYSSYDFAGKALKSKLVHQKPGSPAIRYRHRYAYDQAGRLITTWQRIGSDPEIVLKRQRYNDLGQLVEKDLHSINSGSSYLQSVDYRYHIRGWLTHINSLQTSGGSASTNRILSNITFTVRKNPGQYDADWLSLDMVLTVMDVIPGGKGSFGPVRKLVAEMPMRLGATDGLAWKLFAGIVDREFSVEMPKGIVDNQEGILATVKAMQDEWAQLGVADTEGAAEAALRSILGQDLAMTEMGTEPDDLFAMEFKYEQGNGKLHGDPRHNGNISAVAWRSKTDGIVRGYGYQYDAAGRLRAAKYAANTLGSWKWDQEAGYFDVPSIDYDANGNLLAMKQFGYLPTSAGFGLMDDLRYSYTGNQLQAVRDQSALLGVNDFRDNGATSFQDYSYDSNGNLISDANKGITSVSYNHLNLTTQVTLTGGRSLHYLYAANGTRLARVIRAPGQADVREDYAGAFVYRAGALDYVMQEEGRIIRAASLGRQYRHEYHYRDHLGNLRLAYSDVDFDGVPEVSDVLQEVHYYPYGLTFSGLTGVAQGVASQYQFNGKELQDAFAIGWTDFGARMYDGQIGRWNGVDALAEKYAATSPYGFVLGNPVAMFDPNGKGADWFMDKCGKMQFSPEVHSQRDLPSDGSLKYLGRSLEGHYRNGKVEYRNDGSILMENGSDAILELVNQSYPQDESAFHVKENLMFAIDEGYLILPNYLNSMSSSKVEDYGYKLENAELFDPVSGTNSGIEWSLHTHPGNMGRSARKGVSGEDIDYFGHNSPNIPFLVLEETGNAYMAFANRDLSQGQMKYAEIDLTKIHGLNSLMLQNGYDLGSLIEKKYGQVSIK